MLGQNASGQYVFWRPFSFTKKPFLIQMHVKAMMFAFYCEIIDLQILKCKGEKVKIMELRSPIKPHQTDFSWKKFEKTTQR